MREAHAAASAVLSTLFEVYTYLHADYGAYMASLLDDALFYEHQCVEMRRHGSVPSMEG
jgi:hypothetical protein